MILSASSTLFRRLQRLRRFPGRRLEWLPSREKASWTSFILHKPGKWIQAVTMFSSGGNETMSADREIWGIPSGPSSKAAFCIRTTSRQAAGPPATPKTGYLDCDSSPTKTSILEAHRKNSEDPFWALCFGKRVEDELYDLKNDPDCVRNLASNPDNASLQRSLGAQLVAELQSQGDPRALGRGREFDSCPFASDKHAGLYERFMKGQMKLPGFKESDIDSVQTAVNVDSK